MYDKNCYYTHGSSCSGLRNGSKDAIENPNKTAALAS